MQLHLQNITNYLINLFIHIFSQMEQKAEEQARQNVLNKKKKAMQERIAKERAQKQNMKR